MTRETPHVSLRLPQSLWDRLERIAQHHGRSRNSDLLLALEVYAREEERKIQNTR